MKLSLAALALGLASTQAQPGVPVPIIMLNNGVLMPVIAAGTWQYDVPTAEAAVLAAFQAGFNHVDTANDYNNQKGVGAALKQLNLPRDKYFVTTKVPGCGMQGIGRETCGRDSAKMIDTNLAELQLDYIDLLLVHFPPLGGCGSLNCRIIQEQWAALQDAYAAKKLRAIGVSNFCISCFECLAATPNTKIVPAINQVQYHVGMGEDPEGLKSYCDAHGIYLEAYSPLGDNTNELINGTLTTSIGLAHNKTSPQVALKWIWQNGVPLTTKSTKVSHLLEDIDIFNWTLTDSEMQQLNAATKPPGLPSFMCTA